MTETITARSFKGLGKKIYQAYKPVWKYSDDLLAKVKSPDLAMELAGTDDKKSKEYKAALRNVQRYRKGDRKPQAETQKKIVKAIKKILGNPPPKYPSGVITVTGSIGYSSEKRKRTVKGSFAPSALAEFVDLSRDPDDDGEAPEAFFFEMYGAEGMFLITGKITFEEVS